MAHDCIRCSIVRISPDCLALNCDRGNLIMDKQEKIEKIVRHWLENMELADLERFYIDLKTYELEDWNDENLDETLERL